MLILVGIGSNRGDSIAIVRTSIQQLRRFASGAVRASSLWRTSPVDCPPGFRRLHQRGGRIRAAQLA